MFQAVGGECGFDFKAVAAACSGIVGADREEAKRNVLKLSGGRRQRVAIAHALASDAKVILSDGPTDNPDKDTAAEITAVLRDSAHKSGKCVVIVTYSNKLAKDADVALRLKRGGLLRFDCPRSLVDARGI